MRILTVILATLIGAQAQAQGKAYFYVSEGSKRCFYENTPAGLPVTVSFTSQDNPGVACKISVSDTRGREVASIEATQTKPEGKLTHLTQLQGQHTVCIQCPSAKWFGQSMIKFTLNVDLGDTEINLSDAAKGHAMKTNYQLLKGLSERLSVLHTENSYKEEQELSLHSSTEILGHRVVVCAILQMAVVTISTVFSVAHLTNHFKAQKLVN